SGTQPRRPHPRLSEPQPGPYTVGIRGCKAAYSRRGDRPIAGMSRGLLGGAHVSLGQGAAVISIRRISLGGGYRYLIESVAAGDGAAERTKGLARYYSYSGTPPGVFLGTGLAYLDAGRGIQAGSQVS